MSDIRFNQWLHQSGTGGVSQVASGAVGVGTTNPLADFYVRGDAQITGILTAGHIAMGSSITFGDDDRAYFGNGTDLQIYHQSSDQTSRIQHTGNATPLFLQSSNAVRIEPVSIFQVRNQSSHDNYILATNDGSVDLFFNGNKKIETTNTGAVVTGILTATGNVTAHDFLPDTNAFRNIGTSSNKFNQVHANTFYGSGDFVDLDVDGHTDLDNVNIAGVTTFTGRSDHSSSLQMLAGNNIVLLNDANSANCQIDCYGGAGFRLTSYNQSMFTCENGSTTKFYTDSGTSRLEITHTGDVQVVSGTLHIPDALQHYGDTDTKIRFPANDTISFETAGSERLRIQSNGLIGIGTATVRNSRAVQITGASSSVLLITGNVPSVCLNVDPDDSSDNDRSYLGQCAGSNNFANGTAAGDTILRGSSSGKLHFAAGTNIRMFMESDGDFTMNAGTLYIPQWISHVGDTDSKFGFLQPDIIQFDTAGSTRLKIMNTGQIRIDQGTSANNGIRMRPSGWNYDFRIGAVSSSGGSIWLGQNYEPTGGTRDSASYGTNYLRFTTGGEIYFGTGATDTNPDVRLKITNTGSLIAKGVRGTTVHHVSTADVEIGGRHIWNRIESSNHATTSGAQQFKIKFFRTSSSNAITSYYRGVVVNVTAGGRYDWSGHGYVTHSSSTILMFSSTTGGSHRHIHNEGYNHIHNTANGVNLKISGIAYSYDTNYLYATFSFDTDLSGTGFKPYYNIEVIDPSQCTYDVEGI